MKSFIPVLISVIPVPILMIAFGILWKKHLPKSINWIYGYRSTRAMKNDNTWKFAHLYQARVWRWSGSILLVFALIFSLSFTKSYKEIPAWIFYTELGIMLLTIIPTEIELRRKFDKEGSLR
jgi:uncharacterized membrane protein